MKTLFFIIISLFFLSHPNLSLGLPAFPGAEGFGANSVGGRGGKVIKVTNLNDSGPGSLRYAVETPGRRIVVFEISGIINLKTNLLIRNPYITIAGQTSPGGICVAGRPTRIDTHDVIVQHMRFRLGSHQSSGSSDAERFDALQIWGKGSGNAAYNIIIDHCSFSWGIDEIVETYYGATDITFQWCIFSEALYDAGHPEGNHSMGVLMTGSNNTTMNASLHHNYFVHNRDRNPYLGTSKDTTGVITVDTVNNVVYNFYGGLSIQTKANGHYNLVHNYVSKEGPGSNSHAFEVIHTPNGDDPALPIIYVKGNLGSRRFNQTDDEWSVGYRYYDQLLSEDYRKSTRWSAPSITTTEMSYDYAQQILKTVGASKPVRDSVDERVIADFTAGTGNYIDNVNYPDDFPTFANPSPPADNDNDGMADSWETSQGLNKSIDDSASDKDGDGYTNIEEYLHYLVGTTTTIPEAPTNLRVVTR